MLPPAAAKAKDPRSGLGPLQHRHFAAIAAVVATMAGRPSAEVATHHFATELRATNPKFDKARFLAACGF